MAGRKFLGALSVALVVTAFIESALWIEPCCAESPESFAQMVDETHVDGLSELFQLSPGNPYDEPLATDRPDFTEASSAVGRGVIQLEMGYTFFYDDDEDADVITRTHSTPETLLRVGVTDRVELRLVWDYLWDSTTESGVDTHDDGATDILTGVKVALTEQHGLIPESAMIVHVVVPTGARDFSQRQTGAASSLLYGWDLPCDFTFAGSTGFITGNEVTELPAATVIEDRHTVVFQSITLGVPIAESIGMYNELFHLHFHNFEGPTSQTFFDSGFTYQLTDDLQFDIRGGIGLNEAATDFFTGVGVSVRL